MTARAKSALPTRRPDGSTVAPPRNDYVDERPSTIDVSRFMEDQSWPPTRKEDYLKAMNAILGQKELSPLGLRRIQDGLAILTPDDFLQFWTISVGLMQPDHLGLVALVGQEKERRKALGQAVDLDTSEPVSFSLNCL